MSGYCWSTPKGRNLSVQDAFFEGKKAEETSPSKSTPRTLKEVGQQYPGVCTAPRTPGLPLLWDSPSAGATRVWTAWRCAAIETLAERVTVGSLSNGCSIASIMNLAVALQGQRVLSPIGFQEAQ